uniref:Uncharacterized protein n=1 Tax=Helianthus annuus TaxID=4232 RepID=A0A251T1N9_HELAN
MTVPYSFCFSGQIILSKPNLFLCALSFSFISNIYIMALSIHYTYMYMCIYTYIYTQIHTN